MSLPFSQWESIEGERVYEAVDRGLMCICVCGLNIVVYLRSGN
jgi:hypothetical protein